MLTLTADQLVDGTRAYAIDTHCPFARGATGVDLSTEPDLEEIQRDVAPERVLDTMEQKKREHEAALLKATDHVKHP